MPLLQMLSMPRLQSHDRFLQWQFNNDTWIIACNYKRSITAAITCPREIPPWSRCHTLSGYLPQKWNWNHFHILELMKVTFYWLNSKSFNSAFLAFMPRRLKDERNDFFCTSKRSNRTVDLIIISWMVSLIGCYSAPLEWMETFLLSNT